MRPETETELSALVKAPQEHNLWLFTGDEGYLKTKYRALLIQKLLSAEQKELDYSEFDGAFLDLDELEASLQLFPMTAPRRVVSLTNLTAEALKEDQLKQLCAILADLPPSAVLIIALSDDAAKQAPAKGGKTAKLLTAAKNGVIAELKTRSRTDLLAPVKRELKKYNAEAENSVCYQIIDACNQDMGMIVNECAKLGSYASGGRVSAEDVAAMINTSVEEKSYIMVENIITGNPGLAVKRVRNLLAGGSKPIEITAALVSGYLNLHRACIAVQNGVAMSQFLSNFKGTAHEFVLTKAWNQALRVREGYSDDGLTLSLRADADCKNSRADPTDILVKLIGDLTAAR